VSTITHDPTLASPPPNGHPGGESPAYVINLYTSVTDRQAAIDLAAKVTDAISSMPELYLASTTVTLDDDDSIGEPQNVFEVRVMPKTPEEVAAVWAELEAEERAAGVLPLGPVVEAETPATLVDLIRQANPE
jgi:hypothetical protein